MTEPFPFCLQFLLPQHTNIKETGTRTTEIPNNQSRMLRAMEEKLQTGNPEDGAPQKVHASGKKKNKLVRIILFLIVVIFLTLTEEGWRVSGGG
jgi:hypothetical protein